MPHSVILTPALGAIENVQGVQGSKHYLILG